MVREAERAIQEDLFQLSELDKPSTLFAYGSLLNPETLSAILGTSPENIHVTSSMDEAKSLVHDNPNHIVIFLGVTLEGVRVSVFDEETLDPHYGDELDLVNEQIGHLRITEQVYLMSRPAEEGQAPQWVRGGLVLGLTDTQLAQLDANEGAMSTLGGKPFRNKAYERKLVPSLKLQNTSFNPKHVQYYQGAIPENKLHDQESSKRTWGILSAEIAEFRAEMKSILLAETEDDLKASQEILKHHLATTRINWPPSVRSNHDIRIVAAKYLSYSISDIEEMRLSRHAS